MFERAEADAAALIDALRAATRAEAVAAADRLAVIAAIVAHHCDDEDDMSAHAAIDGWEYATADVSAACGLSKQAASGQMRIAVALRDRLPKVGALLAAGEISAKIAAAITWRTRLVIHDEPLALIDAALAGIAPHLGTLSQKGLEDAIDVWIEKFDPSAVHGTRCAASSRYLEFGGADDLAGTVGVYGRLFATDAAALRARLTAIAATVCDDDPRTTPQRMADALGVLGADPGAERLACLCGNPDCPAAQKDPRSTAVTVYVLTDSAPPLTPPRDPDLHGDGSRRADHVATVASPGVLIGGGVLPGPLLTELVATGARIAPLADPADLPAVPGYRPTTKIATWVRTRDLVCVFPGCNRSAQHCDLDHSVPWPAGSTHPGNLSATCRTHHLLKTFGGWTKHQHPDGSHIWTSPTGHAYTTVPLSRILFPDRHLDTPAPPPVPVSETADRGLAMPQRRRTRAETRAARIHAERQLNQHTIDENAEPPPF
ncbi:uncharacterized protein RMCC_5476 [Mycolicibacterium canariasense]|uniref:HNH nuclease domain-containing protein n=1 Tax=Mycolicibacterium canariasense TaxID=228230 RepID=A0A100WHQ5_MYCCR|nr:HNH endonuclease signature motif containing protein [Mycolicibacterium canariasense]MCV7213524.1 DUF222 domain-containing protein [Mycolicibacterium canariasense]ORV03923.1 hypothetical protein AWB94_23245 [Mycolicibacterium canariasense]GAS98511.1 uncharacterized protein RMCC_5476 [Mycolicibacterium canariasense]